MRSVLGWCLVVNDDALVSVTESAGLDHVSASWSRLSDALDVGGSPAEAVRLAGQLSVRMDLALTLAVRQARAAGLTWEQIGDLLGVTKSAAHQRFSRNL